jgi:hypothetical protein
LNQNRKAQSDTPQQGQGSSRDPEASAPICGFSHGASLRSIARSADKLSRPRMIVHNRQRAVRFAEPQQHRAR